MIRNEEFRYIIMRNGADLCEVYPSNDSAPTLTMDYNGEIKMLFMGSFLDPGDEVDWLTDQIRPELILDGVTHALGIFLPANVQYQESDTTKTVSVQAYDRCWQVQAKCFETQQYFAQDLNYLSAVGSLLSSAGIVAIAETPTEYTLTEGREDWEVGTPNLTAVNELLAEINYKPLWFNSGGVAILEPVALPRAENVQHTLDDTNVTSLMLPNISRETDIFQAPNVFLCVCSNADKEEALTAIAENSNPQSPLSIARRGRRITQVVYVNNIASEDELQVYANRLITESMLKGETVEVETCLLPGHGVGDVVALRYGDLLAVCIERAWSMTLTVGGRMRHTLERVVINVE